MSLLLLLERSAGTQPVILSVRGIASAEAVGTPTKNPQRVVGIGLVSGETFGQTPRVGVRPSVAVRMNVALSHQLVTDVRITSLSQWSVALSHRASGDVLLSHSL